MTKIKMQLASSEQLTNYLKRFSSLNTRLLLEMDFENRKIKAKTSNDNRNIVKSSTVLLSDIFEESTFESLDKKLLIGLHDISTVVSILSTMSDNIEMMIKYDDYEENYIASSITFSSPQVTIIVPALNYKLFRHITDEIFTKIINVEGTSTNFIFETENIEKSLKLISLDLTINSGITDTAELAQFIPSNDGIHLKSDQINYLISSSFDGSDTGARFKKDILTHLDKGENQNVVYDTEKIVFKSELSDTTVIMGQAE